MYNWAKSTFFLIFLLFFLLLPAIAEADTEKTNNLKLIIGDDINYPPYSFLDKEGKPTGFNVELAKAVGAAMGYDVEIRLDEWSSVRDALEAGEIDGISGMFYSQEREKFYDFTVKHNITNGDIFTKTNIYIDSVYDLYGKTVVIQKGDIIGEYLNNLSLGIDFVEVSSVNEALKLVSDGEYDYAAVLKLPGLYYLKENSLHTIKPQELTLIPNEYSMAVKKGNEQVLMILNGGLKIVKDNGEYEKIYDKWLSIYEHKTAAELIKEYIIIVTIVGIGVGALIFNSMLLKHLVEVKTRELKTINDDLVTSKENLRKNEERIRGILNALPDIVFVFDKDGKILECHSGDDSQLIADKKSIIGKYLNDFFDDSISSKALEKLNEALHSGKIQNFEYEITLNGKKEIYEMRFAKSGEIEIVGISRKVTSDKIQQEKITYLSYHDQLTGLYNRRFFEEELKRLDSSRNLPLCIIMGDLNGLKLINDSFGHQAGDKLLVSLAEVLKRACREDEIISRIGGDEFVVLIPKMEIAKAEILINRIQAIASEEKIGSIDLSVSFGWDVKHHIEEDVHEVFNRAESQMYKKKLFEGPSMRGKTIGAIINTLNEKNKREELHSRRVSELGSQLAKVLGFSEQNVEEIKTAGLLHDIGKIGINESLLNKVGLLNLEEFEEIKRHSEIGYRILSLVNDMNDIATYVLHHHERWDGKGYPKGLKGEKIPLQSRIIAIVDTYDAITSERSYKSSKSKVEAVAELRKNAGTQFDPVILEKFIEEVI